MVGGGEQDSYVRSNVRVATNRIVQRWPCCEETQQARARRNQVVSVGKTNRPAPGTFGRCRDMLGNERLGMTLTCRTEANQRLCTWTVKVENLMPHSANLHHGMGQPQAMPVARVPRWGRRKYLGTIQTRLVGEPSFPRCARVQAFLQSSEPRPHLATGA